MLGQFNDLLKAENISWKLEDILPKVLVAGDAAGVLTEEGAKLLDPSGGLKAGIPLCPPEGDAGTGMVATNSVAERTGNVSAGTSVFAMIVLEKRYPNSIPKLTWSRRPQASLSRWFMPTTAPPISTPGWGSSTNLRTRSAWKSASPNCLRCFTNQRSRAMRWRWIACLQLSLRRIHHRPDRRTPIVHPHP